MTRRICIACDHVWASRYIRPTTKNPGACHIPLLCPKCGEPGKPQPEPRKRGRPPATSPRDIIIRVRLTAAERADLEARCAGMDMSEWIARAAGVRQPPLPGAGENLSRRA